MIHVFVVQQTSQSKRYEWSQDVRLFDIMQIQNLEFAIAYIGSMFRL